VEETSKFRTSLIYDVSVEMELLSVTDIYQTGKYEKINILSLTRVIVANSSGNVA